jgi:hypothetical protein
MVATLGPLPAWGEHPWGPARDSVALEQRVPQPAGHTRTAAPKGSFAAWLRSLPVLPGRPPVRLHDGRLKGVQNAHHHVFDLDVGRADLQQCADAIIRLRAEYLWAVHREQDLCFRFTSGDRVPWPRWRAGERPVVEGRRVGWRSGATPDGSYRAFRAWLNSIFRYAGTASLARELVPVAPTSPIEVGDVFIQGGYPGHAVLVVDVAQGSDGERRFLLAQSYMPAQQFHLLRSPGDPSSPWYRRPSDGVLRTPEWRFDWTDRRRFSESGCP